MISQARRNQIMKDLERAPFCGNDARALILQLEDMVKQQQTRIEALGRAEDGQARLLSADEVQRLKAGTPVAVEKLIYHDGKRVYAASWGICTGSLIISLLGTFFPDVVHEIPYKAMSSDVQGHWDEIDQYRFWSALPTEEQTEAVQWVK